MIHIYPHLTSTTGNHVSFVLIKFDLQAYSFYHSRLEHFTWSHDESCAHMLFPISSWDWG